MVVVILCNRMNVGTGFSSTATRIRRTGRYRWGLGTLGSRIAMPIMIIGYFYKNRNTAPIFRILAPHLFGQNDPRTFAYGPSDLPCRCFSKPRPVGTSIMMAG